MEDAIILTIAALLLIGYVALYISGRKYLETFQGDRFNTDGSPKTSAKAFQSMPENPSKEPRPDEYEISAVFQNQGSREASQQQISDAMTRYPLDWSTQGPNSQTFQEKEAAFLKKAEFLPQPAGFYQDLQGITSAIKDSANQDDEEKKILQTYQPKSSKGLLQYSVDDVKSLLHKVYDKKGLIPVVSKSKQGENIWEITELKEKNPKIVWEDGTSENPVADVMRSRGEETISIPMPASDLAAGMDPFLKARDPTRKGKNDYSLSDSGLKRMYETTYPVKEWN